MANSVRVAAVQMTSMDNIAANFATCSRLVKIKNYLTNKSFCAHKNYLILNVGILFEKEAAAAGAKMVCFPESFSYVGFNDVNTVKIGEPLDGPIMKGYCSLARESKLWLSLGGFQERGSDDEHLRNTHVLIDDVGNIRSTYSKIHMFDVDIPGGAVYKESGFTEPGSINNSPDSAVSLRLGFMEVEVDPKCTSFGTKKSPVRTSNLNTQKILKTAQIFDIKCLAKILLHLSSLEMYEVSSPYYFKKMYEAGSSKLTRNGDSRRKPLVQQFPTFQDKVRGSSEERLAASLASPGRSPKSYHLYFGYRRVILMRNGYLRVPYLQERVTNSGLRLTILHVTLGMAPSPQIALGSTLWSDF
ncbi:hypothetical protein HYC85_013959 [Camellia sinensis]|uniref:CN hydrolase domain-containing protein n=1 Tax=Camellia sinensis TaxID=4442 RepID=A0A7J7H4V5_CAMSI|nr:hypothetical protein HYC85_013959 [Camellia sinensis]